MTDTISVDQYTVKPLVDYKKLGAAIRDARETRKLSLRDLAPLAKVTPNTVSEIERGREPSLSVLSRICDVLDLNAADLIAAASTSYRSTDTETPPPVVREGGGDYMADVSELLAIKLSETNQNLSNWGTILGYMHAVHDMMEAVTASQGRVIAKAQPLAQLQQLLAGRPVPDDLLEQLRTHLRNAASADQNPERKAQ